MGVSCLQAYQNHAGDKDLKEILNEMLEQSKEHIKECDELLLANGITPAPAFPTRPEAKFEDIPIGARFMDQEIAAAIALDNSAGLVLCSQNIAMSIREDIGATFAKYHAVKLKNAAKILRMNKDKGWLIPPPLQLQRPELVNV